MGKLLPVLLLIVGIAIGGGAGIFLRPPPPEPTEEEIEAAKIKAEEEKAASPEGTTFVRINNQFIVPVINEEKVKAMVVMSVSLEVPNGQTEVVYEREPKLRDVLLQVLFDFSYLGGFEGDFTASSSLSKLRESLLLAAQGVMGESVTAILITDLLRQDV